MRNRYEAFMAGQDLGKDGHMLNPMNIPLDVVGTYALGWATGWEHWRRSTPLVEKPEWMTEEQFGSVITLFLRTDQTKYTVPEFFRKVENYGDCCGIAWAGMFVGIEKDGYTHT